MSKFEDKVVIVTGSSSGIGAGIVLAYAKLGARVVVHGRNALRVDEVADKCNGISPNGQQALAVVSDVSKLEGCKVIVRRTIEQFGKIDILVNNAGSFPVALITDANYLETVELTTEILLKSVMRMTHLCANYLIATKGCIVNISSDGSGLSDPSVSAYCTCKAAVDKFTKCSAVELSPYGVRVNSVLPSLIDTPILDGFTAGALEKLKEHCNQSYPLRRYGQVEDIVGPVVFLSSPDAAFITGSNLPVDGGSLCVTSGSEWL